MESQLPDAKSTQVDEASAALDTTAHRQAQQSAKCSDGSVSVAHDEPAQGGRLFHRQPRGLAATGHRLWGPPTPRGLSTSAQATNRGEGRRTFYENPPKIKWTHIFT